MKVGEGLRGVCDWRSAARLSLIHGASKQRHGVLGYRAQPQRVRKRETARRRMEIRKFQKMRYGFKSRSKTLPRA